MYTLYPATKFPSSSVTLLEQRPGKRLGTGDIEVDNAGQFRGAKMLLKVVQVQVPPRQSQRALPGKAGLGEVRGMSRVWGRSTSAFSIPWCRHYCLRFMRGALRMGEGDVCKATLYVALGCNGHSHSPWLSSFTTKGCPFFQKEPEELLHTV